VSELEEFLKHRDPRDMAPLVERLYRLLPNPLARLSERYLTRRHMRSIAPRISLRQAEDQAWIVRQGREHIARSLTLEQLTGVIDRPVTIVATGPSAKDHDWQKLRNSGRYVIAVAGATTFLKNLNIRPDLFVVSDSRFALYGIEHFKNAVGVPLVTVMRAASFLADAERQELTGRPFALIEQINSWYGLPRLVSDELLALNQRSGSPFHFPDPLDPHYRIGWSAAPEFGYFSGCTVTFVALQIAVRLGARDIEIVGMDLSSGARAYDEGDKAVRNTLVGNYERVILPSFEMMHQSLRGSGVTVRNLSPVCRLPATLFS
jgi:hypothetical protein